MEGHSSNILQDIAFSIIFAVVAGHVMRFLKQPLLLGYVLGGVLLGTNMGFSLVTDKESIEIMSEIGLILLLFIIGLEINLSEIARMGKSMVVLAVAQFGFALAIGWAAFSVFDFGFSGGFNTLYISLAISLSSTLIVVKLLHDKFETRTVPGKLTIGILIFQDIWAILFMGLQPNLKNPEVLKILQSFGFGVLLVVAAFLISRYILAGLFSMASKVPELVLLSAIAWSFLLSGAADWMGLSMEMGALIAGVSIAAFPYGADVISKLAGVRDFFVTLFFVSLGMKMPVPDMNILLFSLFLIMVIFLSRFLSIVPVVRIMLGGYKPGILTSLNLSQLSEFSLVILALGASYGHISEELSGIILAAMLLASVISTYVITYNNELARGFYIAFKKIGLRDKGDVAEQNAGHGSEMDIAVLGYFRIAQSFLNIIEERAPNLKKRITVIDYHISSAQDLKARGFRFLYGDLAHPEALEHRGISSASMIIVTISDIFLKGTNSLRLLQTLKKMAPNAIIIMTGEEAKDEETLLAAGANHVIVPGRITGVGLYQQLFELGSNLDEKEPLKL